MNLTYRALWRWHFHAGMFCIPFVVVLALTGAIYLFKPQIDVFADRGVDSLVVTGMRAPAEAQIAAAIASVPGSKLFVYEIPREPDDAVRVHLYSADGTGLIVYVHPETLAVLKSVPHTHRLTEFVRTIHSNLLVGRAGSILIELAASWAIIMLGTGLYLGWPRETRGIAGVLFPRLNRGRRVFWRDLHAVTGLWVSAFAMFLLITALPWTTVWGAGLNETRALLTPEKPEWNASLIDEHAEHRAEATGATLATPVALDDVIERVAPLELDPPVRVYLPSETAPYWRVRSETQNRPRVRELELDARSGKILRDKGFGEKAAIDRVIGVGIAAHEGQLFGLTNQLLGLFTALGLITMCISAVVMWWRRRPEGSLGLPAPRVEGFRITAPFIAFIVLAGILRPVHGASLLVLWGSTRAGLFARP
jgi:uncharacterized iron-regulated membrane protein